MSALARIARDLVVAFLIVVLALPMPLWAGSPALGTARGVRAAELSLDGGKSWLPLGKVSLPVLEGARLRTVNGGVLLDLADGSRINVLPFSALRVQQAGGALEVFLLYGRLIFRLPSATQVVIATPTARFEPVRGEPMVGELFAGATTGLKMTSGRLAVLGPTGGTPVKVASLEPVFVPAPPAGTGPFFVSEAAPKPVPGAQSVFSPRGENVGYLRPDGQLVVHPGFAADLTRPFADRLVQLAMAGIPEPDRAKALPLFDVNGTYVGYVAGPVFVAQAQPQPARRPAPGTSGAAVGGAGTTAYYVIGALVLVGAGLGIAAAAGAFEDEEPASPVGP
ncbi:MAG TPA: hypothetical protein VNM66_07725 [Thermodesulfobacteriota bacterium]|nr:hypothetical protein [Thermodesulfobacteriota bacterium]